MGDDDTFHILPLLSIHGDEVVLEVTHKHFNSPSNHHMQKYLAKYMTELIHGPELADQAETLSETLFSRELITNRPKYNFKVLLDSSRFKILFRSSLIAKEMATLDLLKHIFPDYSNSQLKTMIKSGGLRFNHIKITDMNQTIKIDEIEDYLLLNYGKSSFYVIKIES